LSIRQIFLVALVTTSMLPRLLDKAATDAVTQWQFSPTLVNGKPVSVIMTTVLTFTLM
jgi:outer membrane biosynthesis protein TonB